MNRSGKIVWLVTIGINLVWVLIVFSSLKGNQLFTYFNSDTMYLPSLFKDVFIDRSGFNGWHLNGAPNFFPDMLMYFLFNLILGEFRLSMLLFSICQYMFLLLLLNYMMKTVVKDITWHALSAANLLMLVLFFVTVYTGDFVFTFYILSISYHLGAFIMAILCLVFTIKYFRGGEAKYLYLLLTFGFLATLSNRLFIIMFVFPSSVILVFLHLKEQNEKIYRFLFALLLFSLAGIVAFNLIKSSGIVHIMGTQGKIFNFSNIHDSFIVMTGQHMRYIAQMDFRGITVVLSLISFIMMSCIATVITRDIFFKGKMGSKSWVEAFYVYFSCIFFLIVLFVPVINGSYVGWALLRYNIYVFHLSLFNYGYIIHVLTYRKHNAAEVFNYSITGFVIFLLVVTLYSGKKADIREGISTLLEYRPDYVEVIDKFAESNGLQYGVGEYWYAKMTSMFSLRNVRLYTVHENMAIWYHGSNMNWYYKNGRGRYANPEFRFVVTNSLDSIDIARSLGDPVQEYNGPEGTRILEFPEFIFDPSSRQPLFP